MDKRLTALCSLIEKHKTIADIGCDHAYLSIYLIKTKKAERVIASDVKPLPLKKGRLNIKKEGVAEYISLRLSFGFSQYKQNEISAAVIAGMGGDTIIDIISTAPFKITFPLYLQPMTCSEKLLDYLNKNGYIIKNHKAVISAGRYYNVFCAVPAKTNSIINNDILFPIIGALDLNEKSAKALLNKKLKSLQKKAESLAFVERKKEEYEKTLFLSKELEKRLSNI